MSWEGKVITGLGGVACALAILWLTNMWNSIEAERASRTSMLNTMAQTYVTKDAISIISAAREKQLDAIIQRIERNTDQIIAGEERMNKIIEELSRIRTEIKTDHLGIR
jgi:hypothetical protein